MKRPQPALVNQFTKVMSTMDFSSEYEAAVIKGQRLCNELSSFAVSDNTNSPRMDALYHVVPKRLRPNVSKAMATELEPCNISTTNLAYVEVTSFHVVDQGNTAYTN